MNFDLAILVVLGLLSVGMLVRVAMGPTIWDRLLGFSTFSGKAIIFSMLLGFTIDSSYMLDVGLIYALLSFIGTIMIARFIERRGDI